jgi:hypothetical protein
MVFSATSMDAHRAVVAKRNGMLLRLRSWISSISERGAMDRAVMPLPVPHASNRNELQPAAQGATILLFPSSAYGGLGRLASDLRARFASLGLTDFAPFVLEFDHAVKSRLWIDHVAFVEFCAPQRGYRIVIGDSFQERVTIETSDFASIESLARHYIVSCFVEADRIGGAA